MARPAPSEVKKVACVGTGTIGGGWASFFLSRGMEVVACDPAPGAEDSLRERVAAAWPKLERLGMASGASPDNLRFESELAAAVADVEFVQESVFDREELKISVFEQIDAAAPSDVVLSSSSSQFLPTRIASRCRRPERCIVGHPFTPSYLLPLVEVVGGERTDGAVLDWAVAFYDGMGKHALLLRKEIEFYVSNRLQHVIGEEIHRLVDAGVCNYAEADRAVVWGPGLRWAFMGPLLCQHLGGGRGGIRGGIAHFGWGGPAHLEAQAVAEVEDMSAHQDMATLEAWRDDNILAMLESFRPLPSSS